MCGEVGCSKDSVDISRSRPGGLDGDDRLSHFFQLEYCTTNDVAALPKSRFDLCSPSSRCKQAEMLLSLRILIVVASLLATSLAQRQNHFINPQIPGDTNDYTDNKNLSVGSTVNLQWTTNYPRISLILWQNDNASYYTLIDNQPATQEFTWPIDLTGVFDLENGGRRERAEGSKGKH